MSIESAEAHDAAVERDFRRNVFAFAGWEFLWGLGMPFAMFATFAPAYLGALGAPKTLIGVVLSFPSVLGASQILTSYFTPARRRLVIYRAAVIGSLLPWLVYSATALLWGEAWPRPAHYWLYAFTQLAFIGLTSASSSIFWEMMTDNVPQRRRGKMFGWRAAGMGAAGLGMGYCAARVLGQWEAPRNYQIGFLIGVGIYLVSCAMTWLIRDHVNPAHIEAERDARQPFWRYLRITIQRLWSDPNYRIFLFFHALLAVAISGVPFMVDAAREQLHVTTRQQGLFSVIYMATVGCLGWAMGMIADRFGYRLVGCVSAVLLTLTFTICLTTGSLALWYVAYGAYAITGFGSVMLLCNMSAELCPNLPPNRLLAMGNVMLSIFVLLANTFSGAMVDRANSYTPVFIGYAVISVIAFFGFAFIVREPRVERLHIIKVVPKG